MEVKEIGGHPEMCGGWSYIYEVKFSKEDITVKEALEEIAEWRARTSPKAGTPGHAYSTTVDGLTVESTWLGEKADGRTYWRDGSERVISEGGTGGWWSDINIDISTDLSGLKKRTLEETVEYYKKQALNLKPYLKDLPSNPRDYRECAEHYYNYLQLAEWLDELNKLRVLYDEMQERVEHYEPIQY